MTTPNCPQPERLSEYVAGALDLGPHEAVEQHVDTCHVCQATVAELDDSVDTLFTGLASHRPATAEQDDSQLEALMGRAKALSEPSTAPKPAAVLPEGTVLGNYVLAELIGGGGMGQVYRAKHVHMKRDVAIKVLAPHLVGSPEAQRRFQREVEMAARLQHPHVVAAYDADTAEGKFFLAMEYVPGDNLDEIVRRDGPLSVDVALGYLRQAAEGLQYAHDVGIVHRDVKPANLLIDAADQLKVLDLGLARSPLEQNDAASAHLTATGVMMGTAAYLSPEQAENPRAADYRADIYSLGCTLFFLLTGRPVHEGKTTMEIVFAHRERPLPSLLEVRPETPAWVDRLFQRMAAKRREDRFDSLQAVIGAINAQTVTADPKKSTWSRRTIVSAAAVSIATMLLIVVWVSGRFDLSLSTKKTDDKPTGSPVVSRTPTIAMVRVEPGSFLMGARSDNRFATPDEKPQHKVTITKAFELGKFEVTSAEWVEVMGLRPKLQPLKKESPQKADRRPVVGVSWLESVMFCNRLSERHGIEPFYKVDGNTVTIRGGTGYRLPAEAEWEFAARAGTTTRWHFGDDRESLDRFGWFASNALGKFQQVGQLEANRWGLHDMHGNAPEWCWDRYDPAYYQRAEAINPAGSTKGTARVFRGGSVNDRADGTSVTRRSPLKMSYGGFTNPIGLRVARSIAQ
jgi:serine/threonine protein kinase